MKKVSQNRMLALQIIGVGALTGLFTGLLVTLFNALVLLLEEFSRGYYGFFRDNPAFIPLLFLALLLGSVIMGGILRALPILRGNGFPQAEGAAEGSVHLKWYRDLTGMLAASLLCIFLGFSAGAEGPSAFFGACTGQGMGSLFKRDDTVKRYAVTGGASAGLVVALNAPLAGIFFAYEEAHKKFTPELFLCSFLSVAFAVAVRNLLGPLVGLSAGAFFEGFSIPADTGLLFCLIALGAGIVAALLGAGLYHAMSALHKLFQKVRGRKGYLLIAVPFLFAGAGGLLCAWAMGGGVEFVSSLASGSAEEPALFSLPLWAVLLILIGLRFAATALNGAACLPCCLSVPMMAIGAATGKLFALLFVRLGMDAALSDALVVLCMITFFTTVVKAPVTGVIMSVELTWNFSFLLPAVLCTAAAYLVGSLLRTQPLYEKILGEQFAAEPAGEVSQSHSDLAKSA